MTYVISDIHGDYGSYRQMLRLIDFSDSDTLIINGDICDRGRESAQIYFDVMSRSNVIALKGNHESMLEKVVPKLFGFEKAISKISYRADLSEWMDNGGDTTIASLSKLLKEDIAEILEYVKSMPCHYTVKTAEREFIIVHAGICGYEEGKPLDSYDAHDLLWERVDFDAILWENQNRYLVVGHTPTTSVNPKAEAKIYHGKGNIIAIDCGNAYRMFGGKLACLCLDTMEEFYI